MLRKRNQFQYNLSDDAKRAFTSDHELCEVIAGRILQHIRSCPDDITIWKNQFEVQHIVTHHAILHCLWSATVFCNVSSDEAGASAAGIGRIEETCLLRCIFQHFGDATRLGCNVPVAVIGAQYAVLSL